MGNTPRGTMTRDGESGPVTAGQLHEAARRDGSRRGAKLAMRRERLLGIATAHFAEYGYHDARIDEIAREAGVAKGSVFQYYGSKAGLFVECYERAVRSLPALLDAPASVRARGVYAIVRYWLERAEHLITEDYDAYRVVLVGDYGTDLTIKNELKRLVEDRDPYGVTALIDDGIRRGELRDDIDRDLLVSLFTWLNNAFQGELLQRELEETRRADPEAEERSRRRIDQFLVVLRSAFGASAGAG